MMDLSAEMHWQAGIFEGEGSVRINSATKRNRYALLVEVTNTDRSLVEPFQRMWGGSILVCTPANDPTRKTAYRWRAAAKQAEAFLLAVWPCLRTDKYRRRAVCGLDFQAQKSTRARVNRTPEYSAAQRGFYDWITDLNLRGTPDGRQRRMSK